MQTLRKPSWLRKTIPGKKSIQEMKSLLDTYALHTVCEEANCPNLGECYQNKTATFMILGDICTRGCRFCNVTKNVPLACDIEEPQHVAKAVKQLGLEHAVITSVTRDDLDDGGAQFFAKTIYAIREKCPHVTIEVLIPDFQGNRDALMQVIGAGPEIINHNVETVPTLYDMVRPQANYMQSLQVLANVKKWGNGIYTKTGIMVGLGETEDQVADLIADLLEVECDILTIGQYLQPSREHLDVVEYITPQRFAEYKGIALQQGIKFVESGPFVRSSYNAARALNSLSATGA